MGSYPHILFRCDGSEEIGLGHVERCMALAQVLEEKYNGNIVFAIRKSKLGVDIIEKRFPVILSNEKSFDYEKWLTNCIEEYGIDVMILDVRDKLETSILKRLKQKYGLLIVDIDDPEEKRKTADIVFYPPVHQVKEMDWEGFSGALYSGWDYVILRNEFQQTFPDPVNDIPVILVSMGGADPENMTGKVLRALQFLQKEAKIKVLVGQGYRLKNELEEFMKSLGVRIEIIENCQSVAEQMALADIAILSFGITAYEAASVGIPSIYFCLTEDHHRSASVFTEQNLGRNLGIYTRISDEMIINTVNDLLEAIQMGPRRTTKMKMLSSGSLTVAKLIMEGINEK